MFRLGDLEIPIIQAPMAGGASTPELVRAVSDAGALGFLAAGYLTPERLRAQIEEVRAATDRPYGVNLFVPGEASPPALIASYRAGLLDLAREYDVELPDPAPFDTDRWDEKVDLLTAHPVPVVSFTFGIPPRDVIAALERVDSLIVITVTSAAEAQAAVDGGARALCVQGPEAGAHRGTHQIWAEPESVPLLDLLASIRAGTSLPLIATGGLSTGADIAKVLDAGATAAHLGTAYLRAGECGAAQAHQDALVDPRFDTTMITRAFTGRPARGLRNAFIDQHGAHAPAAYPQIHHLTAPLRAAAKQRGDAENMALWAGTGYRDARAEPAAAITRRLWEAAQASGS